jgi:two-component system, NarL family, nitrate/nitrite response regulator NarL
MSNLSFLHTEIDKHTDIKKSGSKEFPLTGREKEVQILLTTGMTNKMIARELGICEGTVKIHVKNLMRKLHARSRLEVALLALGKNMNTISI